MSDAFLEKLTKVFGEATRPHPIKDRGFKVRLPETVNQEEVDGVIGELRDRLKQTGLPKELSIVPLYRFFVSEDLARNPENIDGMRVIASTFPCHPDLAKITENFARIAEGVLNNPETKASLPRNPEEYDRIRNALITALFYGVDRNARVFDERPVFSKQLFETEPSLATNETSFSSHQLRAAVETVEKKINQKEINSNEADIYLGIEFGILPRDLRAPRKKRLLSNEIQEATQNANRLYNNIWEEVKSGQKKFKPMDKSLKGEEVMISVDNDLREMSCFELLQTVFRKKRPLAGQSDHQKIEILRRYYDAQTLALLRYLFLLTKNHPVMQNLEKRNTEIQDEIFNHFFRSDETFEEARLWKNTRGNIVPTETEDYIKHNLRKVKIAKFPACRVYLESDGLTRAKSAESVVRRLFVKPDSTIDTIPDIIAGSLVTWDITTHDFDNSEKRDSALSHYRAMGDEIMGKALALTYVEKDKKALENGEYCFEEKKLNAPKPGENGHRSPHYRVFKIYGKTTDGTPIEFQLIPRNTYERAISEHSDANHDLYHLRRSIKLARTVFARSVYPRFHEVADRLEEVIDALAVSYQKDYAKDIRPNMLMKILEWLKKPRFDRRLNK